jgi:hypothetical protein
MAVNRGTRLGYLAVTRVWLSEGHDITRQMSTKLLNLVPLEAQFTHNCLYRCVFGLLVRVSKCGAEWVSAVGKRVRCGRQRNGRPNERLCWDPSSA